MLHAPTRASRNNKALELRSSHANHAANSALPHHLCAGLLFSDRHQKRSKIWDSMPPTAAKYTPWYQVGIGPIRERSNTCNNKKAPHCSLPVPPCLDTAHCVDCWVSRKNGRSAKEAASTVCTLTPIRRFQI